ncbi:hypothetical protein MASR2M70_11970 [Bacillota bacterium]
MNNNKRLRSFISLITAVLLIGGSLIPAYGQDDRDGRGKTPSFSGGSGTAGDPYLISTVADLMDFSAPNVDGRIMEAFYRLTANIDLGDYQWIPIGSQEPGFAGTFDGNGKVITLRNIAEGPRMGLFTNTDRRSLIKNLTVNGQIKQKLSVKEWTAFGLIVAHGEGRIENCMTEGKVVLTANGPEEFYFGGIAGRSEGRIDSAMNKADLTVNRSGDGRIYMGGIAGSVSGGEAGFFNLTNQGNIAATFEGLGAVGGLAGLCGFGAEAENLLNQGNVTIKQTKAPNRSRSMAGGILGELVDSELNKALNRGNVYFEHSGPFADEEIMAGGIVGEADRARLKNVGNEGNVETGIARYQHPIGITKPGRETVIENAYSKGRIYGSTNQAKGEIYAMGVGETVTANNVYISASVRLKAGTRSEVNGEALANIRPGDKTSIYNYCYWNSQLDPFPGYPTFNKAPATSKAMNILNGKLSGSVTIGGKQYDNVSSALNAWVDMKKAGCLRWTSGATPSFDWAFGYKVPDFLKYKNRKEGKWLTTSDWAHEWMNKANDLSIIPDILLNRDMTKGISRKEFSALALELYENLKGSKAQVDTISPFTDANDPAVSKAYHLGIVSGMGEGLFAPDAPLTREQAAAMLTRVYKAVYWEGWTLENDEVYDSNILDTGGVAKFNDDNLISPWAKDAVYFMVKNDIITGLGNNTFGPYPIAGKDESYGRATREQAFKIAVAMIEKFKPVVELLKN